MKNNIIELKDTLMDITVKMSNGNPGAMNVIILLFQEEPFVDPDSFLPGVGTILALDSVGIYSERIWMLYKDVCKENIVDLIGLMRAWQMGFVDRNILLSSIDDPSLVNVRELVDKVKKDLPKFGEAQRQTSEE
jgi:hypothetical protein